MRDPVRTPLSATTALLALPSHPAPVGQGALRQAPVGIAPELTNVEATFPTAS